MNGNTSLKNKILTSFIADFTEENAPGPKFI